MNTCLWCGLPTKNAKFCSRSHSGLWMGYRGPRAVARVAETRICDYDGCDRLTSNAKYCSRSHAIATSNAITPKRVKKWHDTCRSCEERPGVRDSGYCSQKCERREHYVAFLRGEIDGTSIGKTYRASWVTLVLRELTGDRCERCGWGNEKHCVSGKIPLQIDHIDGDPTNNWRRNLALLCGTCHTLTDTYGSHNSPKGRAARGASPRTDIGRPYRDRYYDRRPL